MISNITFTAPGAPEYGPGCYAEGKKSDAAKGFSNTMSIDVISSPPASPDAIDVVSSRKQSGE